MTNCVKFWAGGTPVAGQQFGHAFDSIGNRQGTTAGGDASGANRRSASYSANNFNQYTSRTIPNAVDVMGSATNAATVTVNGQATYRNNDYYRLQLGIDNSAGPVYESVSNLAVLNQRTYPLVSNVTGNMYLPQNPENLSYDADGNLLTDGRWAYTWDAENRLSTVVARTGVGPQQSIQFEYDPKGRRIGKKVWNNTTFSGSPAVELKFLYDGWNLIAVLNSAFGLQTSFVWGPDLSGSIQGAGGIGGLLEVNDAVNGVNFVAYDGNGNVAALTKAADGTVSAQYEYGPFGEVLRATGPMARTNPFRFSTKYQDDETDLLYYGYRYYNSSTGRWISRDPKEEKGGIDVYAFALNTPIGKWDAKGLACQCEYASVWIFLTPSEEAFDGRGLLTELNAVVPSSLGVYWHISANRPAGSNLGWQPGGWSGRTYGGCLYYMEAHTKNTVPQPSDAYADLDAWGYGNEWIAWAFPDKVRFDADEYRSDLPANWQTRTPQDIWEQSSGWIFAHEVVHAITGPGHSTMRGTLMYPHGEPGWLNMRVIPVDPMTSFQVRNELLKKELGNVTN